MRRFYNSKAFRTAITLFVIAAVLFIGIEFISVMSDWGKHRGIDPLLREAGADLSHYDISVIFEPLNKKLTCTQKINYHNRTGEELTHLYFHLYPNAFKYENKPAFPFDEMERAYPNGFSVGSIDINRVFIEDAEVEFIVGGYSENLLMLLLMGLLMPGERINIEIEYAVSLPESLGRFGYGEYTYKAANWFPIAAVYDERGWVLDRYYPIGDPFYSDAANYRVVISAPEDYTIASTGDIISKKGDAENILWEIEAVAVRDFAWVASNLFKISSQRVDDTTVYSYYFSEPYGLMALEYAVNALEIFNKYFGRYPYRQLSVVETDFFIGGMEYPNLVMIDKQLYSAGNTTWLEIVTVHETAHQWWYGLVGNDQVNEAWLDEALAEYSTVLYYGHRYGPERESQIYNSVIGGGKYHSLQDYIRISGNDETIHRPTYEFPDWVLYDLLVYGKGAMMFHDIRQRLGDEEFYMVLQRYFELYKFKNASKSDLLYVFFEVTGEDWSEYFDDWLYD